jgi:myo-inositol-1(or 4)-monophosphatase
MADTDATARTWDDVLAGSAWREDAATALAAATEAATAVRDLYERAAAATYAKTDGSPVTDADLAADRIVRGILAERFPADAVLTEEGADDPARLANPRCWIVDPIDGTQEFVDRTGNFDVLVALAIDGRPVVAASVQPTTGTVCLAVAGGGAWSGPTTGAPSPVRFAAAEPAPPVIATSPWFGEPGNLPAVAAVARRLGNPPLRTSRVGFTPRLFVDPRACDAVLGFRLGPSQAMAHEWDFAVGDLLVHEAGGRLTDLDGAAYRYNKPTPVMERGFVAAVHPALHDRVLDLLRAELAERGVPGF